MPASVVRFKAPLSEVEATLISTVIYIPPAIMKKLPQARVRAKGTMNGVPFALAIQYRKNGKSHFIVSRPLRKAAGVKPGSIVNVEFRIVSDKVDIPEELDAVLQQDPEGLALWKTFTPGLQRSLCHYVNSVKNVDSRITRALFLVNKAKSGAYSKPLKKKERE
ncbi:MAG TPA: YdeI/OmpD-associated family protein [Chryseosolibacter sp.]|nr:YdeI/OmpD-associated family protein [Chryseosolibacter sp.]